MLTKIPFKELDMVRKNSAGDSLNTKKKIVERTLLVAGNGDIRFSSLRLMTYRTSGKRHFKSNKNT